MVPKDTQYFAMQSALIRTVGASMVLEAQKKSVKRNALIDRVGSHSPLRAIFGANLWGIYLTMRIIQ